MVFWGINGAIFALYNLICFIYKKDNLFLAVAFIHLTCIAALRGVQVGTDTLNYCRIYAKIANGTFYGSTLISKGSILHYYYKAISYFISNENGYMLSTSIPIMIGFFILIKKYVKNYYLGVYFFVASFTHSYAPS